MERWRQSEYRAPPHRPSQTSIGSTTVQPIGNGLRSSAQEDHWFSVLMCGKPRAIQAGKDHFARRPGQEEASGSRPREALAGGPEGGGAMTKRKWLAGVALLAAVTLVAAACSKKTNTSGGGSATSTCAADKFGCDIYKAGEPIKLGTLLSISGSTA